MKKIIRAVAYILCISFVTLALLGAASDLVSRKDSESKYAEFFNDKGQHDILFFGSSHMLNAAFPMELWNEYGYTSYNFAGHGSRIPTTYWIMRNALDYEKPDLVVIDCYYLSDDLMVDDVAEFAHYGLDAFPLSTTKIQAVYELFQSEEDRMSFSFPFSTYHNRWKEITSSSFLEEVSCEKGAGIRGGFGTYEKPNYLSAEDAFVGDSQGTTYLCKMIEYCQQNDIEVILTYIPFNAADWAMRESNRAAKIAQTYNVRLLGIEELGECINFETDLADYGHLNYSGGSKITSYIGKIISENYDIADRRMDANYENWYEDSEKYRAYKEELMKGWTSAAHLLPMLIDKDLMSAILISGQWEYGAADVILKDWGVSDEVLQSNKTFLVFTDKTNDTCKVIFEGESVETSCGTMALQNEDGNYTVTVDGESKYTLLSSEDIGMWAYILDADTGSAVYETIFNKSGFH